MQYKGYAHTNKGYAVLIFGYVCSILSVYYVSLVKKN